VAVVSGAPVGLVVRVVRDERGEGPFRMATSARTEIALEAPARVAPNVAAVVAAGGGILLGGAMIALGGG